MRFSQLCAEARLDPSRRSGDAEVRRIAIDSRLVQDGDCFVAVRGTAVDGHSYIAAAVAAGCAAVVCEDATAVPPDVPRAVVEDTRLAVGPLAQAILGWPARRLKTVGVTGTNGKTTFTYLLRHILQVAGHRPALVGTIEYDAISRTAPAGTTTPSAVDLAGMMDEAAAAGGTHMVMEVSSHALDQGRAAGIDFDVAAFTNLTGDHLDYHGTMDRYLEAKRRLFESLAPGATAVINRDDPRAEEIAAATSARKLWYGLSSAADISARIDLLGADGSRFVLRHGGREVPVRTQLIGRHNVVNSLGAAAAAVALDLDLEVAATALEQVRFVPGRLQRVCAEAPFDVLVDYAHTDDALRNVLSALVPIKTGRLILVFGCGGDRDRTKRPRMASVAEAYADCIVVTSDNPRSEDPMAIIQEILTGFTDRGRAKLRVEPDRRQAIAAAIAAAGGGDIVLVSGKGHETYQVIGDRRVHFDDAEVAEELLRERRF